MAGGIVSCRDLEPRQGEPTPRPAITLAGYSGKEQGLLGLIGVPRLQSGMRSVDRKLAHFGYWGRVPRLL